MWRQARPRRWHIYNGGDEPLGCLRSRLSLFTVYVYVCVLGYPLFLAAQGLASCLARGRGSEQEMNRGGWGVVPQSVGPSWWPKTLAGSTQSGVVPRLQYKAGSVSVSCFILG